MYGHRSRYGAVAIRFAAIIAACIIIVGLLNRPDGDWSTAVNMTPAPAATNSASAAQVHSFG